MIESLSSKSFDSIKYAQLLFAHRHQKSTDNMDMLNKYHNDNNYDVRTHLKDGEDNEEDDEDGSKCSEQPPDSRLRFYADSVNRSPKFYDDSSYQESKKSAPSSLFTIDSILAPSSRASTVNSTMSPISHASALLRHPLQLGLAAAAAASSFSSATNSADFLGE